MAKSKYYAVKTGIKPGIYTDWPACQAQVKGFKGAQFKSFKTREEAEEFIKTEERTIRKEPVRPLIAYVDGSYNQKTGRYGFGCVLIEAQTVIEELSGSGDRADYVGMRNVAGEICGSLCAMNYAAKNGTIICVFIMTIWGLKNGQKESGKQIKPEQSSIRNLQTSILKQ